MRPTLLIGSFIVLLFLPLPSMAQVDLGRAVQQAEEIRRLREMNQQQEDARLVRPTPDERAALEKLLTQKPKPKTLTDADIKWLKTLKDKVAWQGSKRRLFHDIWQQVTGQPLTAASADSP